MPETAAGNTTRRVTVMRRAPIPYAPSRSALGTACIASSATEATSGIVRIPTARPAARKLKVPADVKIFRTRSGLITCSAKYPRTTLGMLASVSRIGLRVRRVRGVAYSDR